MELLAKEMKVELQKVHYLFIDILFETIQRENKKVNIIERFVDII